MSSAKKKVGRRISSSEAPEQALDTARFEVPLGATCEMAWRIVSINPEFLRTAWEWMGSASKTPSPRSESSLTQTWGGAVRLAYKLIAQCQFTITGEALIAAASEKQIRDKIEAAIASLNSDDLLSSESESNRVTFRRGCRLVTGLIDGPDAEKRFERLFPAILRKEKGLLGLEHYREHGFCLTDLGLIRHVWALLPKGMLRKPYERRKGKRGRKKNPKK